MGEVGEIRYKRIPLSDIVLEESFRGKIDDPSLALSASKRGLEDCLVVEGPVEEDKYILIHGYLRYRALVNTESTDTFCIVEDCTNEMERIIKRLRKEFHTNKRTGYELEKMIQTLRGSGLSEQEIAMKTDVTVSTVKKYIKTKDINSQLRSLAEQNGASRDGLMKLWNLPRVKQNVKESFLFRFVTKDGIKGTDVDSMVKVAKIRQFEELSESLQEQCLNRAIEQAGFTTRDAKSIVFEHFICSEYDPEAHKFLYDRLCEQLESIRNLKSIPFFYDHLSLEQRRHLNNLWRGAWIPISPPLKWNKFPHISPTDVDKLHPYN